jgi:hypothetical protein
VIAVLFDFGVSKPWKAQERRDFEVRPEPFDRPMRAVALELDYLGSPEVFRVVAAVRVGMDRATLVAEGDAMPERLASYDRIPLIPTRLYPGMSVVFGVVCVAEEGEVEVSYRTNPVRGRLICELIEPDAPAFVADASGRVMLRGARPAVDFRALRAALGRCPECGRKARAPS